MSTGHCRHRATWIICGGHAEWCYRCGAIRKLLLVNALVSVPTTTWVRPVGDGKNPYEKMRDLKLPEYFSDLREES